MAANKCCRRPSNVEEAVKVGEEVLQEVPNFRAEICDTLVTERREIRTDRGQNNKRQNGLGGWGGPGAPGRVR